MSSTNEPLPPPLKPRISPLDFRNTDLVSRLLAATPPYLYNMSLLPNTYFFSEMLRSLVQAKTAPAPAAARRPRKRPWPGARPEPKPEPPPPADHQPLELTTHAKPQSPMHEHTISNIFAPPPTAPQPDNGQGLILPPPPPIWYPPIYPGAGAMPYGIDPLHFFIDLRVSGHIYDRKGARSEAAGRSAEPAEPKEGFRPSRHASAFSVPVPHAQRSAAINLSHDEEKTTENRVGAKYVLGNVERIYKRVKEGEGEERKKEEDWGEFEKRKEGETEEERQKRVRDLRALIGLELVVDYMNHAKPQARRAMDEGSSTDLESVGSPVEVVALHDET